MKLSLGVRIGLAVLLLPLQAVAQTAPPHVPPPSVFASERGRHHQLVQTTSGHYALLANGLHYTNAFGQWQASVPVIQDLGDFIVCTGATYRVVFNANLNSSGAVDLETSGQQRLVSHPLGIGFYDPESGERVLLAQVKNSRAELVSSNLIVYRDAFEGSGIAASVTYAYRRGRFSQDVTFERAPSVAPADYGMGTKTRLELLTELVESPSPVRTAVVMKSETNATQRARMVEPDLVDEKLRLGSMTMMLGRAFPSEASKRDGIPVAKRLLEMDGRTVLSEAVEWLDVRERLEALPRQASVVPKSNLRVAVKRELPRRTVGGLDGNQEREPFAARLARATRSGKARMALLAPSREVPRGFVLDYETVESAEELTFESGQTYYVADEVVIDGVATFEAGAVIKFAPGAKLSIAGTVNGPSGTVVLTAKDDDSDSAGAQILGSTGIPSGSYADTALAFYYVSSVS